MNTSLAFCETNRWTRNSSGHHGRSGMSIKSCPWTISGIHSCSPLVIDWALDQEKLNPRCKKKKKFLSTYWANTKTADLSGFRKHYRESLLMVNVLFQQYTTFSVSVVIVPFLWLCFTVGHRCGISLVCNCWRLICNFPPSLWGKKSGRNLNTRLFLLFYIQTCLAGNEQIVILKYNIVLLCAAVQKELYWNFVCSWSWDFLRTNVGLAFFHFL